MKRSTPRVTIGLPVFNGEKTIGNAIDTLLAQTYPNFHLHISDNASTDGTARICESFATRDTRITYIRQSHNIGAEANFDFVLSQANSEYFMWAAADDTRSVDFIELNVRFLDQHPDFVGSTCPVRFAGGDYQSTQMGDAARAENSPSERVERFFDVWHANGRFYSLFRREALVRAKHGIGEFLASDWAIVVRLLAIGKMNRVDMGSVDLGRGGTSQASAFLASRRTKRLHWVFPIAELVGVTLVATADMPWWPRIRIAMRLVVFNAQVVSLPLRSALSELRRKRHGEKC